MKKRIGSLFLALCMCLTMLPTAALAAQDENGISVQSDVTKDIYLDDVNANGEIIRSNSFHRQGPVLTDDMAKTTLSSQFYIVDESMTINGDLTVNGSEEGGLVLCEGVTLTVAGALIHEGGNKFRIIGQSDAGKNAGRLVILNSKDDGAAIRTTIKDKNNAPQLSIVCGELEINGGNSKKLVENVRLYSTTPIHKGILNNDTVALKEWQYIPSITGNELILEYCDHPNPVYTPSGTTQHIKTCEQCGFNMVQYPKKATCGEDGTAGYVAGGEKGHYKKCPCGNSVGDLILHNGNGYVLTEHNQKHMAGCEVCGYASGTAEAHSYDADGECETCKFKPVAIDSAENLYDDVNDALTTVADSKATFAKLETHASSKEVNAEIEFDHADKSAVLQMNGCTLKNQGNATLTVENGTLTVTGDATLVQDGSGEQAAPAIRVTGGELIFNGQLTATRENGTYAVEVTGGTLTLKEGDELNGGVSVGGSYNSVNELLGDNLAFATKDGETITFVDGSGKTITGNVTVVKHTQHTYVDGVCACGVSCPHSEINFVLDDQGYVADRSKGGTCAKCGKTDLKAVVGTTAYTDLNEAINAWQTNGDTLKLYADGGAFDAFSDNAKGKELIIDLNGCRINNNHSAINLNGVDLTIKNSRRYDDCFGPINADSGKLTLKSGYLQGLTVAANSKATVELKGGQVHNLVCPKPFYTLMPDGYAMLNGSSIKDPTEISNEVNTQTYDIINAQLQNVNTTKSGSTTFGSGTIPFTLSLSSSYTMWNEPIGRMKFRWYFFDKSGAAKQLIESADVTLVGGLYSYDVTTNMNGEQGYDPDTKKKLEDTIKANWASMTPGDYEVICVVGGMTGGGAYRWQTALTGYTLTVTPASIENAVVTVDDDLTYTGNSQSPNVTVTLGGNPLKLNKDYTISGNTGTNAGNYTLKITGTGNYTGEKTANWSIARAPLTVAVNGTVSKQYDGTDTADVDVVFTGLQHEETLAKGEDYTVTAKYNTSLVCGGEDQPVTGTVTLNNTDKAKNYVLNGNSISATGTITQANAVTGTTKVYIVNNLAKNYTVNLSEVRPKLGSGMVYGQHSFALDTIQFDTGYYEVGTAKIDGWDTLSIPIQAVKSNKETKIGTIQVKLTSENFADSTLTIEFYASNRITPTGKPTLSKTTITYGEALSTITLSGKLHDDANNVDVEGTFEWSNGAVKLNAGKYHVAWIFKPTETAKYAETSGDVEITVNKATPTGAPKYTLITTSGKTLLDAGLTTEGGTFSVPGTVKWVDDKDADLGTDTEVKANTAYKWVFTPDSANYNTISGSITLYRVSTGGGGGGSSTPTYPLNTPSKAENGSVSVSMKNATKGSTVTITVKPDSGYVLAALVVTDKDGNKLTVTDKGDGKYTFIMPAGKVDISADFAEQTEERPFDDVSTDSYYCEAVKWAQDKGITGGIGGGLFGPDQSCTRAQIVTFLWRAAGSPEPKSASGFSDVPADSYYAKAVAWAVENGIANGMAADAFAPDASCTRAQSVTFLFRALGKLTNSKTAFTDVPAGSYYENAVVWATENGITNGVGGGLFGPDNGCTRAQIVTFLYRAYMGK